MNLCPCGSAKHYAECCELAHQSATAVITASDLMRARFSAYVLHKFDYIERSYHPSKHSITARHEIETFGKSITLIRLNIIQASADYTDFSQHAKIIWPAPPSDTLQIAFVHFCADMIEQQKLSRLDELSRFVRTAKGWFYLDGQLKPIKATSIGRNELCPCGSGKKFKQCELHFLNDHRRNL